MTKAILFVPSEETIDASLDARRYVSRLSRRLELETRRYDMNENTVVGDDMDSVAVLAALSSLELESGYMEMELDTVFRPQELLGKLRGILPADFPIVAIVGTSSFPTSIPSPGLRGATGTLRGVNLRGFCFAFFRRALC